MTATLPFGSCIKVLSPNHENKWESIFISGHLCLVLEYFYIFFALSLVLLNLLSVWPFEVSNFTVLKHQKHFSLFRAILKQFGDIDITLYKLCAFPVRMCISGEAPHHSRWGTSPFPVRHIPVPGEAHPHSRWGTSPFPVRHISIPGEAHLHSRWGTSPFPVRMFIPLWFILTGNAHPHRECISSPGMHIAYARSALILHLHGLWRYGHTCKTFLRLQCSFTENKVISVMHEKPWSSKLEIFRIQQGLPCSCKKILQVWPHLNWLTCILRILWSQLAYDILHLIWNPHESQQ